MANMTRERAAQCIQKEMDRRRRHGGAEDVPPGLWGNAGVAQALQGAVDSALSEGFSGNWDEAPVSLEEGMDSLAKALRRVSTRRAPWFGDGLPDRSAMRLMHLPHGDEDRFDPGTQKGAAGGEARPAVVRRDVGGETLADYLSWRLQDDGTAKTCRWAICGGDYLTRDEAWRFLTSPLPKILGRDDYYELGLCPAKTDGRILSKLMAADGLLYVSAMCMFGSERRPPTAIAQSLQWGVGKYCVEIALPSEEHQPRRLKRLIVNLREDPFVTVSKLGMLPKPYRIVDFHWRGFLKRPQPVPYFPDEARYVEGYGGSVIGEMIDWAERLCEGYPVSIWDMLEALLTGIFPPQPALEMFPWDVGIQRSIGLGYDEAPPGPDKHAMTAQGPVTLTVQPWVTPEVVADAWREYRKGNAGYSPSRTQSDTLRFVLSHTPPGGEFQWATLARQWNEERGELMTRGQLHKQFMRARSAILPEYTEINE